MKRFLQLTLIILLGFVFTGCSLKYNLNPPIVSDAEYLEESKKEKVVYIDDKRQDQNFIIGMTGLKGINIKIGNVENPIYWLAQSLELEFSSHNVSVKFTHDVALSGSADAILTVNEYQIINSRTSGFHPYIAYHSFAGKIKSPNSDESIFVLCLR